jgi:hypothetical protein
MAMADPVRDLKQLGRDLSGVPLARLPGSFKKVAFLCVNTYSSYRLNLGVVPLNDAFLFGQLAKSFEFEIYFFHNPHSENFLRFLDVFFARTSQQLILYYVGYGAGITEIDEGGEAFVFDDGSIVEDELITHLKENKQPQSEVILITDACHSGTIWDIQGGAVHGQALPTGVVSISATTNARAPEESRKAGLNQGVFTANLVKTLRSEPLITPSELHGKLRAVLRKYGQVFAVGATTQARMNKPLLH